MDTRKSYLFWKASLALPVILTISMMVLIVSARQSNNDVCLEVSGLKLPKPQVSAGKTALTARPVAPSLVIFTLDISHHRTAVDRRQRPLSFAVSSPNGQYRVGFQASAYNTTVGDLVLQKVTSPSEISETTILQRNIAQDYREYSLMTSVQWSPNSQQFAYLWKDGKQLMLSLMDLEGKGQQAALNFTNGALGSWSPDGAYFRVIKTDKEGRPQQYQLWQSAPFQPIGITGTSFTSGRWSSHGHHYVGLRETNEGNDALVIWSPERETVIPVKANQEGNTRTASDVYWSPDGDYIVLIGARRCTDSAACTYQRRFDIWNKDGQAVVQDIAGSPIPTNQVNYGVFPPNSAWSADGHHFVFIQTTAQDGKPIHDLVSISIPDGSIYTLAHDLVDEYLNMTFYLEPRLGSPPMQGDVSNASSNTALVITNHDDKIKVELAALDNSRRTVIVEGADEIPLPSGLVYPNPLWSADGVWLVIPWITRQGKEKESHLNWIRADGTGLQRIDGLNDLEQVQVISTQGQPPISRFIGYLNGDGLSRQYTLTIQELTTTTPRNRVEDIRWHDTWKVNVSSDNRMLAVIHGALNNNLQLFGSNQPGLIFGAGGLTYNGSVLSNVNNSYFTSTTGIQLFNKLRMLSAESATVKDVATDVFGNTSWSPDGAMLAYLSFDTTDKKTYVNVVSASGDTITRLPVQADDQLNLWGWTKCQ